MLNWNFYLASKTRRQYQHTLPEVRPSGKGGYPHLTVVFLVTMSGSVSFMLHKRQHRPSGFKTAAPPYPDRALLRAIPESFSHR